VSSRTVTTTVVTGSPPREKREGRRSLQNQLHSSTASDFRTEVEELLQVSLIAIPRVFCDIKFPENRYTMHWITTFAALVLLSLSLCRCLSSWLEEKQVSVSLPSFSTPFLA
jgi:hypothetical protein